MKDIITDIPPTALFLLGFVGMVSFGLLKLNAMLQAAL